MILALQRDLDDLKPSTLRQASRCFIVSQETIRTVNLGAHNWMIRKESHNQDLNVTFGLV